MTKKQMKEQGKSLQGQINEEEISKLPEKEFGYDNKDDSKFQKQNGENTKSV